MQARNRHVLPFRPPGCLSESTLAGMDWGALVGGLIGAGIPGVLAYLGLRRGRQSADAEAFGPAVLVLAQLDPQRVTFNFSPDAAAEADKWKELQQRVDQARERLLVVSAGNPRRQVRELAEVAEAKLAAAIQASGWVVRDMQAKRDNPGWLDTTRRTHAEAETALRELISANFSWRIFPRHARTSALPRGTSRTAGRDGPAGSYPAGS